MLQQTLRNGVTLESIISRMMSNSTDKYPHRRHQWLWHMKIQNGYHSFTYQWPSLYIKNKVYASVSLLEFSYKNRSDLFKQCSSLKLGNIYEGYVRHVLFQLTPDNYLHVTNRDEKKTEVVQYPTSFTFFYTEVIQDHKQNTLYVPIISNQKSIDLAYPPYVFQVTISKNHPIKDEGLSVIKGIFPSVKKWKLCFIVPTAIKDCVTIPYKDTCNQT